MRGSWLLLSGLSGLLSTSPSPGGRLYSEVQVGNGGEGVVGNGGDDGVGNGGDDGVGNGGDDGDGGYFVHADLILSQASPAARLEGQLRGVRDGHIPCP